MAESMRPRPTAVLVLIRPRPYWVCRDCISTSIALQTAELRQAFPNNIAITIRNEPFC
jgi:hypothetical protein